MIARLTGTIVFVGLDHVVIDVNGVGYEVRMPQTSLMQLPLEGGDVTLSVHTNVREDAIELFGFLSDPERNLFRALITATGIGPKMAMSALSTLSFSRIVSAIISEDSKTLATVPGIGKKLAEKMIIELKDKVAKQFSFVEAESVEAPQTRFAGHFEAEDDFRLAFESLGYKKQIADKIVAALAKRLPRDAKVEALLREALTEMTRI